MKVTKQLVLTIAVALLGAVACTEPIEDNPTYISLQFLLQGIRIKPLVAGLHLKLIAVVGHFHPVLFRQVPKVIVVTRLGSGQE